MTTYRKWYKADLADIAAAGLEAVLTEVEEDGRVVRELGIGDGGRIVYLWPGVHCPKQFERGLFREAKVDLRHGQVFTFPKGGARRRSK